MTKRISKYVSKGPGHIGARRSGGKSSFSLDHRLPINSLLYSMANKIEAESKKIQPRKRRYGNRKFTDEEVLELRRMYERGDFAGKWSPAQLSMLFGVAKNTMLQILRYQNYCQVLLPFTQNPEIERKKELARLLLRKKRRI